MSTRRTFIKKISALSLTTQMAKSCLGQHPVSDSDWQGISEQFFRSEQLNFNTGSAGMMPRPVYENYIENIKKISSQAPYEVLNQHSEDITAAMDRLGLLIGAPSSSLAFVRNTTEGLNALLWGFPLKEGDEIVYSNLGYPYVHNTLQLLKEKRGIKPVRINISPEHTDDQIVATFQQGFSPASKLLVATHITHRAGRIMPVKQITASAQQSGVEVILDAAHVIGHIPHNVTEIGCDYYVTSLHKWLAAPLGSGLLYIKKEHLAKLFPSYAYPKKKQDDIIKFDYTGTMAFHNKMTLSSVLDFHDAIGIEMKTARLRELAQYLVRGLKDITGTKVITDLARSGGIVTFSLPVRSYKKLVRDLDEQHKIHLKMVSFDKRGFLRASMNLHLMEVDIDRLLAALSSLLKNNNY